MVYDLSSVHKKPYEVLLLGRVNLANTNEEETVSEGTETSTQQQIGEELTLVSVPCSVHSRKPPLSGIII